CDAAQIGAIQYAFNLAKQMNLPIEKIWLDGGNAKTLMDQIQKANLLSTQKIEVSEGLVLRGVWAWLLKNI
ncbi:MAG: hypothetical protein RI975_851, partial [Pseudomonadota bacterium]